MIASNGDLWQARVAGKNIALIEIVAAGVPLLHFIGSPIVSGPDGNARHRELIATRHVVTAVSEYRSHALNKGVSLS